MNWLDIIILCFAAAGLIKGLKDGMIRQVVSLAAFVVGVFLCREVAGWLSRLLSQLNGFPEKYGDFISYFIGFVLIVSIVIFAGKIVHKLVSATPLGIFNHLTGGILGLVLMLSFISLAFNIIELFDKNSFVLLSKEIRDESRFYYKLQNIISSLYSGIHSNQ
jgi:membrane protein required for colicin V production